MTLIEKEPIMKFIQDGLNNKHYGHVGVEIITEVEYAPTIDAVPVVRCKDCKHRYTSNCTMLHTEWAWDEDDGSDPYDVENTIDNGFCYMGEPWTGNDYELSPEEI